MDEQARWRLQELVRHLEGGQFPGPAVPQPGTGVVLRATGGQGRPQRGAVTTQVLKRIQAQLDDAFTCCGLELHPLLWSIKRQAEEYAGHGLVALENYHTYFLAPRLQTWRERYRAGADPEPDGGPEGEF